MATIGEAVRQVRHAYGMSQAELARRAQISLQAMNDIEQGRTKDPRFSIIQRIARVLGVSLDHFRDVSHACHH